MNTVTDESILSLDEFSLSVESLCRVSRLIDKLKRLPKSPRVLSHLKAANKWLNQKSQLMLADREMTTPDAVRKDGHPKQTSTFEVKKINCSSHSDFPKPSVLELFRMVGERERRRAQLERTTKSSR